MHDTSGGGPAAEGGRSDGWLPGAGRVQRHGAGRNRRRCLGAQFVTWARDYDWRGVNNGHYYVEDYQGAKEDFALRSGLVARERVFDREQLEELRRGGAGLSPRRGAPPPTSRSTSADAYWSRSTNSCRATEQNQMQREGHHLEQSM
ncbi:MAG: hypothetical protein ACLRWQ_07895 [Flavonifractor plautii]